MIWQVNIPLQSMDMRHWENKKTSLVVEPLVEMAEQMAEQMSWLHFVTLDLRLAEDWQSNKVAVNGQASTPMRQIPRAA